MRGAEIIPVIRTELERRGDGRRTPLRVITQYWSPAGELLAEVDPTPDEAEDSRRMRSALERIRVHAEACLQGNRNAALEVFLALAVEGLHTAEGGDA